MKYYSYDRERAFALLNELAARQMDPLDLYEPQPWAVKFHQSKVPERLVIGGNRTGKTLAACIEVARAVLCRDPYKKYPKKGKAYLVGFDGKHIGETFYPKLFKPGSFAQLRLIRDRETDQWRAWRPFDPEDLQREKETVPHPPLIPERMIALMAFERVKENILSLVTLRTGWEVRFHSSKGLPTKGSDVDLALFDEELNQPEWYAEVAARLFDRKGKFIWTAAPQEGGIQMVELYERGKREEDLPPEERTTEVFQVKLDDNPYFSVEERSILRKKFTSEHDILSRIEGEIIYYGGLVYPEFAESDHIVDWRAIPDDWTLYVAVDPGRQIGASLFAAVPPPKDGDYVYLWDEIYIPRCNAELWGQAMHDKCAGRKFEAFVIDWQEGRKADTGSGQGVADQYANALRKRRVECRRTAAGFSPADQTSVKAGVEEVRSWLLYRDGQPPKLRILRGRCPNLIEELQRYSYLRVKSSQGWVISDKPQNRGRIHATDCLRYLAMERPVWRRPEALADTRGILDFLRQMREKEARRRGLEPQETLHLGPR